MNIIFEGIDASGKTTIIKRLIKKLNVNGEKGNFVREIENSPLQNLLNLMLEKDYFFRSKEKFKTSIHESFILASALFYKQEALRDTNESINIYDRDIFTLLAYQKVLMKKEYGEKIEEFMEGFEKCILFDLKKIDYIVYVSVPEIVNFKRVEERDGVKLLEEDKEILINAKIEMERYIEKISQIKNIKIINLNGESSLDENLEILCKEIL